GLGIGLANLEARINGAPNGYRLAATGDTDYGPLSADVVLLTAAGPLTIDVERADLSGIGFRGRLVQSAAGPFVGQLDASGQGLGGLVRLSAVGAHQAAAINLRANNVVLPGPARLAVGSAIVDADVILYDSPRVIADIQLAQTRIRDYDIAVGRVKIDYQNGAGKAQALIEGTSGAAFRVAANADLRPELWRASVQGRAAGISFRTTSPARIIPRADSYELLPTNIDFGRGSSARLAGRFGEGLMVQSRLDGVNLTVLNAIYPGMGLGGRASGSLDFEQANAAAFPRADARLTISDFTRTTAATVSQPVDVNLAGKLLPDGGELRAVMRRRGSVIGRMQASLRPLGPGAGDWTTRLTAAPLGGGIRYNGPADTLFSFVGSGDQRVAGPIAVAADFGCRLSDPCLNGVIRGNAMTYENLTYGTRLTDMVVNGRFSGDRLEIEQLSATAGDGNVRASGYVSLAQASGYPMKIDAVLDNARLARSDDLSARATGNLTLEKVAGQTALLSGSLRLPETRYRIVRQGAAQVPVLTGVRRKPPAGRPRITGEGLSAVGGGLFELIRLDIRLQAPDEIYVAGMGLESEWRADVTLRGTTRAPRVTGEIELVRGTLGFAGRSFELQEGRVTFPTGDAYDPSIHLLATDTIDGVTVNVGVSGRAQNPQIVFSSVPGLPQDEIVSRILFGDSITSLSPLQAVQLAASLNSLRGSGGLSPLGALQSATGIDRLRILGPDDTAGRGTAVAAGQHISNDIYLEVITDGRGYTATQLEISLTPALSILSQAGGSGQSNLSIRYRKDY
ncbi:MAG TPA: translocation/assembly module TamB domain-containing protein, partial [Sphingopyxis sp.]|nr:translocation/assembly module TamB domain-containing protein [Sphingopyxis sp.]